MSLKTVIDEATGQPTDELDDEALRIGESIGSTARLYSQAKRDEHWIHYINEGIREANLVASSRAQNVQKFRFLPVDLSIRGNELTPTLKLKRNVVYEKYSELIDSMYKEAEQEHKAL